MVELASNIIPLCERIKTQGVWIPFQEGIISANILDAMRAGRFEAEEAKHIPGIVLAGDRVLEVGAGVGLISTLLARQPEVEEVIAVEANPLLMDFMERVHSENGVSKVRRVNAVLTNDDISKVKFYLREDFWMGSLLPEPNPFHATVDVPTLALNELLRTERISLIVCDIEGAEVTFFENADLAGVSRIFIELHDHVTGMLGVGRLFSTLAEKNFVYDPRHSEGSVVLFRKIGPDDLFRSYAG